MAGIASDRSPGIQINPISTIGTEVPVTPAVGDLMDAFRQGFITTEDIQQRFQGDRLRDDQLKTQLQAGDFQRKLAPGAAQNALAQQGLTADQIQAAQRTLPGATDVTLGTQQAALDAQRHEAAANSQDEATRLAELQFRETRNYEQLHGHPAPKFFEVEPKNPEPVLPFDQWFEENHGSTVDKEANDLKLDDRDPEEKIIDEVNKFKSDFPLNSKEDNQARAAFENKLREQVAQHPTADQLRAQFINQKRDALMKSPEVHKEYAEYEKQLSQQKEKVTPDSPEYLQILQARNQVAQQNLAVTGAKLKALPGVLEAQAKATAEAPGKRQQRSDALQKEYGTRKEIHDLRQVQAAYYKLDRLLDPNVPPSAQRDQGAIFSWMKILDPGSTVREGEYATAKNARGVPDKIAGWWNQVVSGQILTPDQRVALKEAVTPVYLGQVQAAAPTIKQFLAQEGDAIGEVVPQEDANLLKTLSATPNPAAAAGGAKPTAGAQRVIQNGVTFQWNGTQYVPVQ